MRLGWYHLILFFLSLSIVGCTKTVVHPPAKNVDVYVAGSANVNGANNARYAIAAYWKNGSLVKLSDSTAAAQGYAIAVNNGDVYVAGYIATHASNVQVACYWKNGQKTDLTDGSTMASASSIAIYNGIVYVAGSVYNKQGYNVATLWKNGVATQLSDGTQNASISAIAIDSGDIYLAGTDGSDGKIWKNGVATAVSRPVSEIASLSAVAVQGADVYAAGFTSGGGATYWKNGTSNYLANTYNSYASGIAVNKDDVYVSGDVENVNQNEPSIWINNDTQQWQSSFASYNTAAGMAVNGQDIYVAGTFGLYAGYWLNGVAVQLSPGAAFAIAVVAH